MNMDMNNKDYTLDTKNDILIDHFIENTLKTNSKLAFITSGGCNVRLEKNTVRKINNFSTGTRRSLSAENFLFQGYKEGYISSS